MMVCWVIRVKWHGLKESRSCQDIKDAIERQVILVLTPRKRYTVCIAQEGEKVKQTMNCVE